MAVTLEMGPHFAVLSATHDLSVFFSDQVIELLQSLPSKGVSLVAFDLSKCEWVDA